MVLWLQIQNGHPVLVRKFKIKWWDSFTAESKSSKLAVTEWLQKNQTASIIDHHPQSKFLAQKAQTAALLAFARTEEEYLQIVQTIIQSQDPKTVLPQSSSSDSTSLAISLGDDNEDDCFGILPPVKRHKKKVSAETYKTLSAQKSSTYKRWLPLMQNDAIHLQKVSPTTTKGTAHLQKMFPTATKARTPLLYKRGLLSIPKAEQNRTIYLASLQTNHFSSVIFVSIPKTCNPYLLRNYHQRCINTNFNLKVHFFKLLYVCIYIPLNFLAN